MNDNNNENNNNDHVTIRYLRGNNVSETIRYFRAFITGAIIMLTISSIFHQCMSLFDDLNHHTSLLSSDFFLLAVSNTSEGNNSFGFVRRFIDDDYYFSDDDEDYQEYDGDNETMYFEDDDQEEEGVDDASSKNTINSEEFDYNKNFDSTSMLTDHETISTRKSNNNNYHPLLLPDKLFTIVGLEDSSTKFITTTLIHALGLMDDTISSADHETVALGRSSAYHSSLQKQQNQYLTEIQHITIPSYAGTTGTKSTSCQISKNIIPVVYPGICYITATRTNITTAAATKHVNNLRGDLGQQKKQSDIVDTNEEHNRDEYINARQVLQDQCLEMMHSSKQTIETETLLLPNGTKTTKIKRKDYVLNITSHIQWYRERGVDAYLILVSRDASITKKIRISKYRERACNNTDLIVKEQQIATDIMKHAVMTSTNNNSNKNVILISYEMLHRLQQQYLKLIYDHLGINSTYAPTTWTDENSKYVNPTIKRKAESTAAIEGILELSKRKEQERMDRRNELMRGPQGGEELEAYLSRKHKERLEKKNEILKQIRKKKNPSVQVPL